MFRNPFGRVRSSCSARRFRPENWTKQHELDQIKSLALLSKLWSKPNEVSPQTKKPTISNVKSLVLWSEWRESNSRPLEPHSSALPKLRYTRISTAASLPKRGDMKYYTQIQQFCQPIFAIFFAFFAKSLIFAKVRALFIFALSLAEACLFPKVVSDTGR